MDFYEPPVSLWEVIKSNASSVELDEIRYILGSADVDLSLDLRQEVESLLEIWQAVRDEKRSSATFQLVDQSEVRKRLVSEIKLFIDSIRENPDVMGVVRIENLTSRPVVKMALAEYDRSVLFRTSTSLGSDGRETPSAIPSPSRSTPSRQSGNQALSYEDLVGMRDKFKIDKLLEVLQHLKTYLAEEIAQLKEDVIYLRNSIDEESAMLTLTSNDRASLSELRSERNEVEAELRWAAENSALLRPAPHPSKRHGSLVPLEASSSRPSSSASTLTLTKEFAQTSLSLTSTSPPQTPPADGGAAGRSSLSPSPRPPASELKSQNIRVISGHRANVSMKLNKQLLPSKTLSIPHQQQQPHHPTELPLPSEIVVTRPPLPPSTFRKSLKSSGDSQN